RSVSQNYPSPPGREFTTGTRRSPLASRLARRGGWIRQMRKRFPNLMSANVIVFLAISADAQFGRPKSGLQPMKSAVDLIKKQAPLEVNQALLAKISPDDVHIIVSLEKQRAYLMLGEQIVIDSPISSGKRGHTSSSGSG